MSKWLYRALALMRGRALPLSAPEWELRGLAAQIGATANVADRVNYTAGPYLGFLSPWSVVGNSAYVQGVDYQDTLVVRPATFPKQSTINWKWPTGAVPTGGDVWSYLQIAYGNYDGGLPQTAVTPRQVKYITSISSTVDWSFTGSAFFNELTELYLCSTEGDPSSKVLEVGFFLHAPASTVSFHGSGSALGTFTDASAMAWDVRYHGAQQPPYVTLMPPGGATVPSHVIDWKGALAFLVTAGTITGSEWVNGLATGVEITTGGGVGSFTVNDFTATMAGTRGALEIIGSPMTAGQAGSPYSFTPKANNGTKPYTFSYTGTLPAGLSFATATGAITGTPTASGTFGPIVIAVKDATNATASLAGFSLTIAPAVQNNLLTNGDFASGATGWAGGGYSGMDISGGTMNFAGSPQYDGFTHPSLSLTAGTTYKVTYTVSNYVSGTIRMSFTGGTQKDGVGRSANGTFTDTIVAATGNNTLLVLAIGTDGANTFKIDNVSVTAA